MGESLSETTGAAQRSGHLWLTVLLGTIVCCLAVAVMPSTYVVADDLGVQMILAGEDGFAPAAEVPFFSLSLNYILVTLYQWFPAMPWYGLLLTVTQAIGLSLLLYSLMAKLKEIPWLGLVFPFFLIFSTYALLALTFTQATLTLIFGVAAVIALRGNSTPWPAPTRRGLALLLLWALLWRWKFGICCLVFFAPLFVIQFEQLRQYLSLLGIVACFLACDRALNYVTSSDDWNQYLEFYDARARLFDMPSGRAGEHLDASLQAAGWSEGDYRLIRDTWMLYDQRLTSTESMEAFMNAVADHGGASITEQVKGNLLENATLLKAFLPIGIAVLLLGLKSFWRDPLLKRKLLAMILFLLPVLFLTYFRLKPRVLVPEFLYGFCLLNIWTVADDDALGFGGWGQKVKLTSFHFIAFIPIVIGFGMSYLVINQLWTDAQKKRSAFTSSSQFITDLSQPVILLRTQVGALPGWEGVHPFSRINDSNLLRVIPAGWQVQSPRYHRILSELGFSSGTELIADFASRPDDGQYFVQRFDQNRGVVEFYSQQWLDYLKQHHADRWLSNPQLDVILIGKSKRSPQRLSLLKLLPKSNEPEMLESLLPEK